MIEDHIMYCRNEKHHASGSIKGKISALKLFFSMNDVTLNWLKISKLTPEKKKIRGAMPISTQDIQSLLSNSKVKDRALIHFMASSGVRVGVFSTMKIKDLKDIGQGCKSVLVYADHHLEYHTFIHQEAVKALDEYLDSRRSKGETITPDSWVFSSPFDRTKPYSSSSLSTMMNLHVKKNLKRGERKDGRYDMMSCHGFRKRFVTICASTKNMNNRLSEKLVGHSTTISS